MVQLTDLPDDIRKRIIQDNKSKVHELESFQIYATDLSRVFDIGEIADMFVVNVNGSQVLRIRYYNKDIEEFPTVKAPAKKQARSSKPAVKKAKPAKPTRAKGFLERVFTQPVQRGQRAEDREPFGSGPEFKGPQFPEMRFNGPRWDK